MINNMTKIFSTYSFVLLVVFCIIGIACFTQSKKYKQILFLSVCTLSIMAFLFDPVKAFEVNGNYTDLYRFWLDMVVFSRSGWNASIGLKTDYSSIFLIKALVYFVAKTRIYRLLAFFSAFLSYGIFAYVLCKIKEIRRISGSNILRMFFVFICLINYKVTITNIRMPIGMSLFALGMLFDFFEVKSKANKNIIAWLLYLSTLSVHVAFSLFIFVRLLCLLFKSYNKIKLVLFCIVTFIMTYAYGFSISILSRYTTIPLIGKIVSKLDFYTSEYAVNYSELPAQIVQISNLILLITCIWLLKKYLNSKSNNLVSFCLLLSCTAIGSFWSYVLFNRITNFFSYVAIFLLLMRQSIINESVNLNFSKVTSLLVLQKSYIVPLLVVVLHLGYYFVSYQYRVLCF